MNADNARVVWYEGLFLRPHHFQQQERFFEWQIRNAFQQLVPRAHGFSSVKLEQGPHLAGKPRTRHTGR